MRRIAFWLAVALVFTLPWEATAAVPGVGTISRLVGLAAAGAWALSVVASASVRRPTPAHLVALTFVVWNGLSVFWSVDVQVSIGKYLTLVQLFGLMYLLWDTVRAEAELRIVMQAYVLGAWGSVIAVVVRALSHPPTGYEVRFGLGDFNFDDIGFIFALGIPLAWYLATTATSGGHVLRLLNFAHVPAATVGVMLSGSRVALIAIAPSLVYMGLSLARLTPRARVLSLAGISGLLVALLPLVPASTMERLVSTSGDRTQGDFNGRTELWHQAYLTFTAHPLTGVGTGAFRDETSWKVAHDVWLRFAAELGLVGLMLFVLLLAMVLVDALREPRALRQFSFTVLTVWVIGATFYNLEVKKVTWLALSLLMIAASLPGKSRAQEEPLDGAQPTDELPRRTTRA